MTQTLDQNLLSGDFRTPKNAFQESKGSIHNDAVASKLGFKGGTVPGSVHMAQFVPMLVAMFGTKWFETGDISLYFTQATVDREEVRAEAQPGDDGRASLRMYNRDDALICTGTATSHAPDAESECTRRMREQTPAALGSLRILADVKIGDTSTTPLSMSKEVLQAALANITEPLPIYETDDVLPPSQVIGLAHQTRPDAHRKVKQPAVGLFGALETRQFKGPLKAGVNYLGTTKILKLTDSPRTENVWYDVSISDPETKDLLGSVIFMIRFMKASSPLWAK
jgi:hypothetical protein